MITAELKINGLPLSIIYIRRFTEIVDLNDGKDALYIVEYYQPEKEMIKTLISHDKHDDAFLSLFEKSIQVIKKMIDKKNVQTVQKP